jgi:hypothetical protein
LKVKQPKALKHSLAILVNLLPMFGYIIDKELAITMNFNLSIAVLYVSFTSAFVTRPFGGQQFFGKKTTNVISQCSGNQSLKLIDANVVANILSAGNQNLNNVCQANNQIFSRF